MPAPSSSPPSVTANFRLFIVGQFVSLCGTWMQTVAQGWLVLQLTDSAFTVGLVTALGLAADPAVHALRRRGGRPGEQAPAVLILQALHAAGGAGARGS